MIKTLSSQYWHLGLVGMLALGAVITYADSADAQSKIVPDTTLGAENSGIVPLDASGLPIDVIDGGALRGSNLFHSFTEFNVAELRAAYFRNPSNDIQNILARVTGNNRSEILGTLGIFNATDVTSNPNLFLINPNGIIFGKDASLDVGGSFVATTANAVQLGSTGLFSASEPEKSNLLAINPSAFLFSAISAQPIINRSTATTTLFGDYNFGLLVPEAKSFLLLGGDVKLDGGLIAASGGRIELGGVVGQGVIGLDFDDNNPKLSFPDNVARSDLSFANGATVSTNGNGAGTVQLYGNRVMLTDASKILSITLGSTPGKEVVINANHLTIQDGSNISVSTAGQGQGGNLRIIAPDSVKVIGVTENEQSSSGVFVRTQGDVAAGNIQIETGKLTIQDGAVVSADTSGGGNAGNITIRASKVEVIGASTNNQLLSTISTQVNRRASGNGGNLTVTTGQLIVRDGGQVITGTLGQGLGGTLTIASDSVELLGATPNKQDISRLITQTEGLFAAGDLTITTERMSIRDGAQISTATLGAGRGGSVNINASDSVELGGTITLANGALGFGGIVTQAFNIGDAGNITIKTGELSVRDGSQVSADTIGVGNAGDIGIIAKKLIVEGGAQVSASTMGLGKGGSLTINVKEVEVIGRTNGSRRFASLLTTQSGDFATQTPEQNTGSGSAGNLTILAEKLSVRDGAQISTRTFSRGRGGSLIINISNTLQANNGVISANSAQTSGGNITITAQDIRLRNNSNILTNSGGGDGGNISLDANTIIALENSDILAFAPSGTGGNITFNTRAFLSSPLYRSTQSATDAATLEALRRNNRVDVNASGAVSGTISGVPDITFLQNSLTDLQQNPIDTSALIANSCIARSSTKEGSFTIVGAGGLPYRPGDASPSTFTIGQVREVEATSHPWKKGAQIIEPSGVYQLANGQLVMSRECS
ncbi:filamentous hemagglutinin-like protein (plasmid) [Calothrix sp. NIES-4071]|nr:filamentous hemagglutinin-like protein [Calothrix sp. NIES-4071]BAZ64524.1 filamentous hemagglutinin-like protein [Calothrix sp. NIES-4105]